MTALGLGKVNAMTEGKFKVGDVVTCVNNSGLSFLTEGKDYKVEDSYPGYVSVLYDDGSLDDYLDHRFELAQSVESVKPGFTAKVDQTPTGKIKSDGGSSAYYQFPDGAKELNDLIEHRDMSFARGNMFKALYRLGEKEGVDVAYDLNKMQLFLDRLKKMHSEGKRL